MLSICDRLITDEARRFHGEFYTPTEWIEEVDGTDYLFNEGLKSRLEEYEYFIRDPEARLKCLKKWGCNCYICGKNLEKEYGITGKFKIEVHHIKPICEGYRVTDPEKDLIPLCPNCHTIIHTRNPMYEPEEVSKMRYKEINDTVKNLKTGDIVHFMWTTFPDGTIINGGSNIIEVNNEVTKPNKEWLIQEQWDDERISKFENLRKSGKLSLVTLQTDYCAPTSVIMHKDMPVTLYRQSE